MAGKDQDKDDRPVSDWPNMDPRWWMMAAVASTFGLAIPGATFAAVAVFSQKLPETAHEMVTVLVPFGTIILALITFFTVVWRGLLTDQQVKEQRRQNDAKDDEMLAKLLVDGAGLLGEENEAKQIAGVSALHTVATAPSGRYASNAMDILLAYWEKNYRPDGVTRAVRNAYAALAQAAQMGRRANTGINLIEDTKTPNSFKWIAPPGAQFVHVKGGWFDKASFEGLDRKTNWTFAFVRFEECIIGSSNWSFYNCMFMGCAFSIPPLHIMAANHFGACNFSGAIIDASELEAYIHENGSLKEANNFFYEDNPPVCAAKLDWPQMLVCLPPSMRMGRMYGMAG